MMKVLGCIAFVVFGGLLTAPPVASQPHADSAAVHVALDTLDGDRTVPLSVKDGDLYTRLGEGPAYLTFPADLATLYVPGLDAWVSFPEGGIRWTTVFDSTTGTRAE